MTAEPLSPAEEANDATPPPHVLELIAGLRDARREERRGAARQLWLAARFADAHATLAALGSGPVLPGCQRMVRAGSDGTGLIAEFCVDELAVALEMSVEEAHALVWDAVDLRARFPRLWGATMRLEVSSWMARKLATICHEVDLSTARRMDHRMYRLWESVQPRRLFKRVEGWVFQAMDRKVVHERHRRAMLSRGVSITQQSDGVAYMTASLASVDAVLLDAHLDRLASILREGGDPDTHNVCRSKALALAANPLRAAQLMAESLLDQPLPVDPAGSGKFPQEIVGQVVMPGYELARELVDSIDAKDLAPQAEIVVHVDESSVVRGEDGVVRIDGLKPHLTSWLKEFLPDHKVRVQPVIDIAGMESADHYEIPERMRRAVCFRNPYTVFPHSRRRSTRTVDIDHTQPFETVPGQRPRAGQTRIDNLGPLTRRQHRVKTHGGWDCHQITSGIFLWKSPHGIIAVTTPSGSWTLHIPEPPVASPRRMIDRQTSRR